MPRFRTSSQGSSAPPSLESSSQASISPSLSSPILVSSSDDSELETAEKVKIEVLYEMSLSLRVLTR